MYCSHTRKLLNLLYVAKIQYSNHGVRLLFIFAVKPISPYKLKKHFLAIINEPKCDETKQKTTFFIVGYLVENNELYSSVVSK